MLHRDSIGSHLAVSGTHVVIEGIRGRLQLVPALCRDEFIDGGYLGLLVDCQLESLGQQGPHACAHSGEGGVTLLVGELEAVGAFKTLWLRYDIESLRRNPTGTARDLK